ncbi:RNA-directed RNA polymerase [Actinidia chinensis var. chinensis]|uniref:RNA-directed RNA polymerase n=1 Tax=Actinidia chinensis var. chinensis TaxID=1590841 RepID=A0A2R6QHH8_ACTCC|nr:RNA-directed RNA polymerase [Actinidia chinensis var. chinensis]
MPPRNARGRTKSITGARGDRVVRGDSGNCDEDGDNHQESVMGGGANAPRENVGGVPPAVLGGMEFMQGVFTAIEQVVRNTMRTMEVPVYSTMVSSAAVIEETLNKTRNITNLKSQREGASAQSEGNSSKKSKSSTAQQQYLNGSSPIISFDRVRGLRDGFYAMTSVAGPSRTARQHEPQLDTFVVEVLDSMLLLDIPLGESTDLSKIRVDVSRVCLPGPFATEVSPRQRNELVTFSWKIMSSISRDELDVHRLLTFFCSQKFCNMKLLFPKALVVVVRHCRPAPSQKPPNGYFLGDYSAHHHEQLYAGAERAGLPFKAINSHVADKQSIVVLPVLDIADFSPVRECCREA